MLQKLIKYFSLSVMIILMIQTSNEVFAQKEINTCDNGRIQHWDKIVFRIMVDKNDPGVIPENYIDKKLDIRISDHEDIINSELYAQQSLKNRFALNETQIKNISITVDDVLYDVITCTPDPQPDLWELLKHPLFTAFVGSGLFAGAVTWLIKKPLHKRDEEKEKFKLSLESKHEIGKLISSLVADFNNAMELLDELPEDRKRELKGLELAGALFKQHLYITLYLTISFPSYAAGWVNLAKPIDRFVDLYRISDKDKIFKKWATDETMKGFTTLELDAAYNNLKNDLTRKQIVEQLKQSAMLFLQKIIDDPHAMDPKKT